MTISRHPQASAGLAMTPLQQGMLFHGLREPGSAVYFQQMVVQLAGSVDTGALQRAWNSVVERHEALRMRGDWRQEFAVQHFDTSNGLPPFIVHDYRAKALEERGAIRSSFLQADRDQGFEMALPPLMRITLLRWTDEDWDLVWSHHHVLLDGWSSGLVLAEVMQCYDAQLRGHTLEQALVRPYSDFLQWLGQRDTLAADAFWTETLDGFEQPNTLAVLKRNTAQAAPAPMVALERRLDAQEMQALTRVSQSSLVSPASATLACWGLLLGRYSDSEDVVFGVTTSGRPAELPGSDRMVGLFINTIPLRVRAPRSNATQSIAEWLGAVQKKLAAARAHEHTALTRIAELSSLTSGQSLFDTIAVYENYPLAVSGKLLGDAHIVDVRLEERPSYPLSLVIEPAPDGLLLRLLVDTSRIAVEAADRMLGQFEYLVRQLAQSHPDDPVSRLQLLRPKEHNRIVHVWNATEHPYDQAATLPGLFLAQAARTPDAVAIIDHRGALTYTELRQCVAILASRLTALDLPPNGPVGARLGRDRNLVIALLAIISTGHHYVPLETTWPAERVDAILDALPICCILTDLERLAITSELTGVRTVAMLAVDAEQLMAPALPAPPLENHAKPHQPAYVIFTSGSTGRPKGVLVHHTKAVNLIEWVNRSFGVGPQDRLLFITSPAFDLSVYDIFGVLTAGGSIRIAQEADLANPERLADLLINGGITFWDSAPAALAQLIPLLPDRAAHAKLRLVFLSGDWIPLPLPDQLKRIFPGVQVVALGGATEATIWSNFHVVDAIDPAWASVPYGRPIQNTRYYVLDAGLAPCPIDTPGDLFIGGDCLAEGYVGQPELTAERFIPDPFSQKPHARMYRTGDRAKFGSDGVLEFLGRVDTQVKIRGFRIELGEIEVAMRRQAAVSDAICVLHDSGTGGPASGTSERNIIGYFVVRPGHSMTPSEMRQQLAKSLPAPMIPAFLLPLDSVPLSSNGKVDRKSLPAPKMDQKTAASPALTGNPLRETIAAVWCQVLGLEAVSHDENFFELGGHSLRATAAVARLRSTLGMDIPLALIFEKPTILGMAGELRKLNAGDTLFEEPHLRAQDFSTGIPLSRAQQRLWFIHQLEPDNPNYNVALAARITGNFDIAAFTRAVEAVIRRHDILNARIDQRDPQPVMLPMSTDSPLPVEIISLHAHSVVRGSDEAMRLLTQASRMPFRLDRERPVRVLLVATAPELFHVMVLMDHIVTDGWSMGIFAHALFAHYAADVQHLAPPATETAQYGDFTAWWDQQVEEKLLTKQLAYWKTALADLPQLALPTDTARPSVASFAGTRLPFTLDKGLSAHLRRTALQHSSTLFMVLLTAFEVVLRRRSGQDEVVVGTDISGRDHPLSERIIGFFVNQLVLRTDFRNCATFTDMLAEVRRCTLDSFYHQHVPFEVLVKELNPSRDSTGTPFFRHKFVLQNAPAVQLQAESFVIEPIDIDTGTSKYDLLLTLIDEDVLRGTLEISTDVFSVATAQAMVSEFTTVLTQVATDATISYDSLVKTLNAQGDARANLARSELRRSGLQRLRDLTRAGAGTA